MTLLTSAETEETYPYLVIRPMATVHSKRVIEFVEQKTVTSAHPDAYVTVVCPEPFSGGNLTDQARDALIEAVKHKSNERRIPMCIVFGTNDLLYINPDGTTKPSTEAPSGGLWFPPERT